jgi:uncharacterized protein (DUF1778 family)
VAVRQEHQRRERMTVSVSRDTRDFVRSAAARHGTDQSAVVEEAVRRMQREERRTLTQEALLAQADDDARTAEAWASADAPLEDDAW